MITLVANLGSTSFKFKLFEMTDDAERVLAIGAADRIGQGGSSWSVDVDEEKRDGATDLADHAAAIDQLLAAMLDLGAIDSLDAIDAVGFKAVHGGPISGAVQVDDKVIVTMEQFADVAPAHNPPYIAAMKAFAKKLPGVPQVAAFETGFHQTIPTSRQAYGIPHEWMNELGIRRYGFHGASHRYIATRMAEIDPNAKRIISCHLGGSSSICAINSGRSVANSFGMTAQSGTFHNNRVGDFDVFALQKLLKAGMTIEEIFNRLGKESGLKGLSGVSADMREVEKAAAGGNTQAQLAIEAFVESCRAYIGSYLAVLNGAHALVFTGGIGQHGAMIREGICIDMDFAGIMLNRELNSTANGNEETRIDEGLGTHVWVLPTNEELIVARQTVATLSGTKNNVTI